MAGWANGLGTPAIPRNPLTGIVWEDSAKWVAFGATFNWITSLLGFPSGSIGLGCELLMPLASGGFIPISQACLLFSTNHGNTIISGAHIYVSAL